MRLAAGIVCYETKLAERVRRSLPRKVVGVAPNTTGGFGRPTCGRDGRANLKKALCLRREFYLVGLGRLVAEKEFDRLPYILARVRAAGLDAGLILVGEGPARVPIERRAADLQLAQGDIVFTGAIGDQQALANWLGAADIHVHPGAIGLAVVDAHFAGIPTVIPSPGRKGPYHGPEWSYIQNGETGWVVEENTDESLAQVVVDYLRKPAAVRDEMSERCADYARRNLGIEQMVDGIIETIELVLRSRKA
jgi:glycosyltransferase involved in cell wall biosynthesis